MEAQPPTKDEQTTFANALDTIESVYQFSPSGVFVFVSWSHAPPELLTGRWTRPVCPARVPETLRRRVAGMPARPR